MIYRTKTGLWAFKDAKGFAHYFIDAQSAKIAIDKPFL